MNRKIKRYTWKHSPTQTLNGAIMYFQRYVKRTYGKKKINVLIDALLTKKAATAAGEACGLACNASAATPATWGDAMEVPLMVLVAVLLSIQDEVMLEPGAKIPTQLP